MVALDHPKRRQGGLAGQRRRSSVPPTAWAPTVLGIIVSQPHARPLGHISAQRQVCRQAAAVPGARAAPAGHQLPFLAVALRRLLACLARVQLAAAAGGQRQRGHRGVKCVACKLRGRQRHALRKHAPTQLRTSAQQAQQAQRTRRRGCRPPPWRRRGGSAGRRTRGCTCGMGGCRASTRLTGTCPAAPRKAHTACSCCTLASTGRQMPQPGASGRCWCNQDQQQMPQPPETPCRPRLT